MIQTQGLSEDECVTKLRLLSLAAAASGNTELTFEAAAAALGVPLEDAEQWIILAITHHFLDAKIDQIKQVITIKYVGHSLSTPHHHHHQVNLSPLLIQALIPFFRFSLHARAYV